MREPVFQCWQVCLPVDWQTEGPSWASRARQQGRIRDGGPFGALLRVTTRYGAEASVMPGDWVIWEEDGQLAVCKEQWFWKHYEPTGRKIGQKRSVLEWT